MLRSLRNFIISLLISGMVFGTVAYFLSGVLVECLGPLFGISAENILSNEKDEQDKNDTQPPETDNSVESSFSMLIINTNYKPSQANEFSAYDVQRYPKNEKNVPMTVDPIDTKRIEAIDFMIIRGNSKRKEFTYTYVPSSMQVSIKGRYMTLNEVYRDLGVSFLTKKMSALTGFEFDSYAIYDLEDIAYIVDYIGGITYNVPIDIKDVDNNTLLSSGSRAIKGAQATMLFEYQGYNSPTQRSQMVLSITKAMMAKITNKIYKIDIVALHRSSSAKVDTTATITSVNTISSLLYSYTSSNISDLTYPGNYKKTNGVTLFIPNIASAISRFASYR